MHIITCANDSIRFQLVCPHYDMMHKLRRYKETIMQVRQLNDTESRKWLWEIGHRKAVDVRYNEVALNENWITGKKPYGPQRECVFQKLAAR